MFKKFLPVLLALVLTFTGFTKAYSQGLTNQSPDMSKYFPGLGAYMGISANDCLPNTLNEAVVTLTAAQLDTMFTTPIQLIPAPGAGQSIVVDYALFRYASGGTAFTGGGAISLKEGTTTVFATVPAATINSTTSSDTQLVIGASNLALTQNTALTMTNATAVFATGNGTVTVYIYYTIQ